MKKYEQYLKEERQNLVKSKRKIVKISLLIAIIIILQIARFFMMHTLNYVLMLSTLLCLLFLFAALKNQKANMKVARMDEKEIKDIQKQKGKLK